MDHGTKCSHCQKDFEINPDLKKFYEEHDYEMTCHLCADMDCMKSVFDEISDYDGTEYGETLKAMSMMTHVATYMSEEFQKALDKEMRDEYWRILKYARLTKIKQRYHREFYQFEWGEYK